MFKHLNDILFDKQGDRLSNVDSEEDYSMFMINRWISMYSSDTCSVINSTVNWLHPIFETKQQHYRFLSKILPTYRKKFIQYIKKNKYEEDTAEDELINLLARNLELSKKEVKYLIEQQNEH